MQQQRTTPASGALDITAAGLPQPGPARIGAAGTARALIRLARAHRRLRHLPTVGQVRAMAWFDGRQPCSYLLHRQVNFVPEPLEFGYEQSDLGRHALCFTGTDP